MDLHELTILKALELIQTRAISSTELTKAVIDRIDKVENKVNAYITLVPEEALISAAMADQEIKQGNFLPLGGIPLAIKDLICTAGLKTTCGSKILADFIPPYDAGLITKLKQAGAVIIGKLNMDEFAMGSTNEHSAFKNTHNPWDLSRIPGGSSGGSAAAVAADMCLGAFGSDTGGSIRQPASHCGVVGMKPTYGRISRFGLVAFASSLDQIGPLAKSVGDCALLLKTASGYDPRDSTSVNKSVPDYSDLKANGLKNLKIGIPKEFLAVKGIDADVLRVINSTIETFKALGAEIIDISLPHTKYSVAVYYVIAPAEASSNLARYDGVKYGFRSDEAENLDQMYSKTRSKGFGTEVQRRIILGTYALSSGYYDAYYKKASQVRTLIIKDYKQAFNLCDLILTPVTPTPAFKIGEKIEDPLQLYLSDIFTISANLAGIPGICVPAGFSDKGLPIGMQLLGSHFQEDLLLNAAYNFEQATDFHRKKPDL